MIPGATMLLAMIDEKAGRSHTVNRIVSENSEDGTRHGIALNNLAYQTDPKSEKRLTRRFNTLKRRSHWFRESRV